MALVARDSFADVFDFFGLDRVPVHVKEEDPIKFKLITKPESYVIRGVIPGFSKEEMKLSIQDRYLTIEGKSEGGEFGSSHVEFSHRYEIPRDGITDNIEAEVDKGLILIRIPRWKSDRKARQINIK